MHVLVIMGDGDGDGLVMGGCTLITELHHFFFVSDGFVGSRRCIGVTLVKHKQRNNHYIKMTKCFLLLLATLRFLFFVDLKDSVCCIVENAKTVCKSNKNLCPSLVLVKKFPLRKVSGCKDTAVMTQNVQKFKKQSELSCTWCGLVHK